MYRPEDRPFDRLVIAYVRGRHLPGRFTGATGPHGESYEIDIGDELAEYYGLPPKAMVHAEDLYERTDENCDRFF